MANDEQLTISLPDVRTGLTPVEFAFSELKTTLPGKLIRVTHEVVGKTEPEIEGVICMGIDGKFHDILRFFRPETIAFTGGQWAFASPNYGISEISLLVDTENQLVIYRNPEVAMYYRSHPRIPVDLRQKLVLSGRWYPPCK
jgi:hypothetical protein